MVHVVVLAALVIGIVAIIPSAMAHHTDSTEEAQCKKWHLKAITDYIEKGHTIPVGCHLGMTNSHQVAEKGLFWDNPL